jgi:hypothetical protein
MAATAAQVPLMDVCQVARPLNCSLRPIDGSGREKVAGVEKDGGRVIDYCKHDLARYCDADGIVRCARRGALSPS